MGIATVTATAPCRFCKVRSGDLFILDSVLAPQRWDGAAGSAWAAGVPAPTVAPSVSSVAGTTVKTITNAVNATGLIRITATAHGYSTGNSVYITGVTGTTEANGTWVITVITANTFDLQGSTFANAYVSGGTAAIVKAITNAVSSGGLIKITATGHGFSTGNSIYITGVTGTTEANGTWVITVVDANSFTLNGSTFLTAYVSGGTAAVAAATGGDYYCAYRFLDSTAASAHFPNGVPSNLSPLTLVSATAASTFNWTSIPSTGASARAANKELYRTLALPSGTPQNGVVTMYLVTTIAQATTSYTPDNLTDTALSQNAALPILAADGSLNANRFVPPPSGWPYVVHQQDRMMLAGNTTASYRNCILFSEPDEPESMPLTNILTVQDNTGDDDEVTGLIQHGMRAFLLKERHIYSIQWIRQPQIDGAVFLVNDRGAVSDRCCTWMDGLLYVMDTAGIYSFDGARATKPISEPIADLWINGTLDFANKKWWWASHDPVRRFVFFAVGFVADGSTRPLHALVYHVDTGTWDVDTYPWEIGGGAVYTIGGQSRLLLGSAAGVMKTDSAYLTDGGSAIAWKHKTGMLEYPVADTKSKRSVTVSYKPTVNATGTITLQIFRGYSTSAVVFNVPQDLGDGITIASGSSNIVIDITYSRSSLGSNPGYNQYTYQGLVDDRSQADRYVTFQLSGSQSADAITLYDIEIQGSDQ